MQIVGHRGARGLAPENTIASFQKALDCRVDAVECDVRVTSDGVVVLAHGEKTENDDGTNSHILHYTYKELKGLYGDLVTLDEAIEFIARRKPLFIEIKEKTDPAPTIACLQQFLDKGWSPDDFLILSFDYQILKQVKKELPQVPLMVNDRWSGVRATRRARRLGTNKIDIQRRVLWKPFIKAVSKRGFELYTYTQNDAVKAVKWQRAGLVGVITDYPDRYGQVKS